MYFFLIFKIFEKMIPIMENFIIDFLEANLLGKRVQLSNWVSKTAENGRLADQLQSNNILNW